MKTRFALLGLWAAWIFGSSCTVITTSQWLGSVHQVAPKVASPAQLESFWDRYWWVFVKGYHVLEFTVLCLLANWALANRRASVWTISTLCVLYAATDEFHQHFVHDRGGRWTDVLIDTGGVALAVLLILWRQSRLRTSGPQVSLQPSAMAGTSD